MFLMLFVVFFLLFNTERKKQLLQISIHGIYIGVGYMGGIVMVNKLVLQIFTSDFDPQWLHPTCGFKSKLCLVNKLVEYML